ncbi:MAG: AAA family ATPase [Bacteroidota bacterium]
MRLKAFRVQNYRSVIDTGWVDIESQKTIFVGPNEAGKSATLQALQQINAPAGVDGFDALRDYPRRLFNDISTGKSDPDKIPVVDARFELSENEKSRLPSGWEISEYVYTRFLSNRATHSIEGAPEVSLYKDCKNDFARLALHADKANSEENNAKKPSEKLKELEVNDYARLSGSTKESLVEWLDEIEPFTDEDDEKEQARIVRLRAELDVDTQKSEALKYVHSELPVFVLYNNYLRVRPIIHLANLARRQASDALDDEQYDYGNLCFLKLLGFDVDELSELGNVANRNPSSAETLEEFRKKLDERRYSLNAAEVRLTESITSVWNPDTKRGEASQLRLDVDGQLLTVSVVDELGVSVELDQRSEGFQWLVSFFIIFFAEAEDAHSNAILLLDEPGVSLHGLKQREFQKTIDKLSENNQTIFTTHSPFMVGPDELDKVRVVEMPNRREGTKIHTTISANDAAALLPLQEALGYDLAQSLFTQTRNLVLEGLTDYWYLEACSGLLRDAEVATLEDRIALVPAASAGKVVYFATILHAQSLKVAALFDSDKAGKTAANHEVLAHQLGNKRILQTEDFHSGEVKGCEIEDLLRVTLTQIVATDFGKDVSDIVAQSPKRPVIDIFAKEVSGFSKYKLAKAFVRWSRDYSADDLTEDERNDWAKLIQAINAALK